MAMMMSFRVPARTRHQLESLATRYHTMTAVMVAAIDRLYHEETAGGTRVGYIPLATDDAKADYIPTIEGRAKVDRIPAAAGGDLDA